MTMWSVRGQSLAAIKGDLKKEGGLVEEAISFLEKSTHLMIAVAEEDRENATFAALCAQTLAKSYRLSKGSYSLCLDGLVVEARPLIRLLLESWQVLVYFREDPTRVEQVASNTLPSAGNRAKQIKEEIHGELKGLRDFLNVEGSHISFGSDSLVSVVSFFDAISAKEWFRNIYFMSMQVVFEAAKCLDAMDRLDPSFWNEIDVCRDRGFDVFEVPKTE